MLTTIVNAVMLSVVIAVTPAIIFLLIVLIILLGLIGVGVLAARHIRAHY